MIPSLQMHRFEFIVRNSDNKILDVGCNDTSLWAFERWYPSYPTKRYINEIMFFDCDVWLPLWLKDPKFVRGDALNLPFKNNTFDTIVFGDVLEHVADPLKALQDAKRVTKNKIVITLPCESEWTVGEMSHSDKNVVNTYCGYDDKIDRQEIKATLEHPTTMAKCVSAISDAKYKHIWHQQLFNDESIIVLLNNLNMKYNISKLYYVNLVTYGIVCYK